MPPQDRAPVKDADLESMSMNLKEGGRCIVNRDEDMVAIDFDGDVSLAEKEATVLSSRHRSDAAGGVESSNVGPSNWQRHGYDWEVAAGSLLGGRAEHREKKKDAGQGELLSFESENEFVVPSQHSTERRWAVALTGALGRGGSSRGGSGCGERAAARWQER
ncbi:hypothetical protein BHM03_00046878 [Ensete ventricosum]|nr:hypothetical protein BHM03_00046878 [Ensete ventricosum]